MANPSSTPRAQSLTMPEDQPRASSSPANADAIATTLRLLLTAQNETNTLLKARLHARRSLFSYLAATANLIIVLAALAVVIIMINRS